MKHKLIIIAVLLAATGWALFLQLHGAVNIPKPSPVHEYPPAVSLDEYGAIDCTDTETLESVFLVRRVSDKKLKLLDFCRAAEDEKYTWDKK